MAGSIALGLLTVLVMAAIATVPPVANTTYSLYLMSQDEDRFWNYDFMSGGIGRPDRVDQAVTIVFCGNATKSKVKNVFMSYGFTHTGSMMYHQLDDGNGLVTNNDAGMKTAVLDRNGWHYRVYAPWDSNTQNSTWNKYVIVTTHKDQSPKFGWSEDCENYICCIARGITGWAVYEDVLWFANRDWPWQA